MYVCTCWECAHLFEDAALIFFVCLLALLPLLPLELQLF
jgi:hypothetical protein